MSALQWHKNTFRMFIFLLSTYLVIFMVFIIETKIYKRDFISAYDILNTFRKSVSMRRAKSKNSFHSWRKMCLRKKKTARCIYIEMEFECFWVELPFAQSFVFNRFITAKCMNENGRIAFESFSYRLEIIWKSEMLFGLSVAKMRNCV